MNYDKHYDALMERAKRRYLSGYKEKHHVLPRCIGGEDSKSNVVTLTPEEHYLAHLLLVKMERYKNNPFHFKLVFSANMMTIGVGRNNKSYGWVRRRLSEIKSQLYSRKKQSPDHIAKRVAKIKGKKRSPEMIERFRLLKLGVKRKPFSAEHIEKIRLSNLGKKHTEEAKRKISQSNLGKPKPSPPKEHVERLAEMARNRKDTEITTKRRSESAKAGWAKRRQKDFVHPNQGKQLSEETKRKISNARKKNNDQ